MRFMSVALAALIILCSGCASRPQEAVRIADNAMTERSTRIGVAIAKLPQPDTSFPGASCLLCIAAASAANSALTAHTRTLPQDEFKEVRKLLAERISKRGATAEQIDADINVSELPDFDAKGPNIARKDFTSLRSKLNVDKLLLVVLTEQGMLRPYSAYIPTSPPRAYLRGQGFIVDLKSNAYEWYQPLAESHGVEGEWHEPPKFPGLTNAYFRVLETAKDTLLKSLGP